MNLVIIDTLARVMAGGDENSGQDMGRIIAHCGQIQKQTGAAVMLIHHVGKDEGKGSRGHSSLSGAVDTELHIKDGVITVVKQRDGERGAKYKFELKVVELGKDAHGKIVTSCVVEQLGRVAGPRKTTTATESFELVKANGE